MDEYNLIVIGAGSAGRMAAIKAALFGHDVAVIDSFSDQISPEMRLKRVIMRMSALDEAGKLPKPKFDNSEPEEEDGIKELSIEEQIAKELQKTADEESDWIDPDASEVYQIFTQAYKPEEDESDLHQSLLNIRNIKIFKGRGRFINLDQMEVLVDSGKKTIEGSNIIIASGAKPHRPDSIEFDDQYVFDIESIFEIDRIPNRLMVYGFGEVACELAVIFAYMGSKITLVTEEENFFSFIDDEIRQIYMNFLESVGIDIIYGEEFKEFELEDVSGKVDTKCVKVTLESMPPIEVDALIFAEMRKGSTEYLDCQAANIELDENGFVLVNENYQSNVPHIYAAGHAVMSPMLESVAMDSGRAACTQTFGLKDTDQISEDYPVVINTFPQIAYFGWTEEELKENKMRYVVGSSTYRNSYFARKMGLLEGKLKLLVCRETQVILGVHVIGRNAAELVEFGMSLVEERNTVSKIIGTVIPTLTLHDMYIHAALNAVKKLNRKLT